MGIWDRLGLAWVSARGRAGSQVGREVECVAPVLLSFECEQRVAQAVVVSDDDGGKESQGRMTTKIIYNFQHKTTQHQAKHS